MSSSNKKKVHYERGTKGGKSSHRSSKDSGVGSSSASDRASLGTTPLNDSPFNQQQIEEQRLNLSAVQEALDAANEQIKHLEASYAHLDAQLFESNKKNRLLKRENEDYVKQIDYLIDELDAEKKVNERIKRESSPRTGGATSVGSGSRDGRPSISSPRRETADPRPRRRDDERLESRFTTDRRWSDMNAQSAFAPPMAPQPPHSATASSFPSSGRPASGSAAYPASGVTYASAPISYVSAPIYPVSTAAHNPNAFPNDGRYHPYPL